MKIALRYLRVIGFVLLLVLSTVGVALPIPYYHREDPENKVELVLEEEKEN